MRIIALACIAIILALGFVVTQKPGANAMTKGEDLISEKPDNKPTAIFAGGCFWCVESEFRALDGVLFTRAGYMGGDLKNPGYRDITTGETGHAEVVEVTYDPDQISYDTLVEFFLTKAHDPTQLNRQGVDVGTQYRSAIFPISEEQETIAREAIRRIEEQGIYSDPIVTTVETGTQFWEAEDYHQQYYEKYEAEHGKPHLRVYLKQQSR